ncbi:MAG: hypothetical protein JNL38_24300 [Myxococcales bacterium]|nr:hypothetical protein [Myxococcales bacterium]
MRWAIVAVLLVHGLIHFLGVAKAYRLAELPALKLPISRGIGALWLAAGVFVLATAVALVARPSAAWMIAAAAVVASQAVIVSSWSDARVGTLANVVLVGVAVVGFAAYGPLGMRAEHEAASRRVLAEVVPARTVTEDDLRGLPAPVQRYLRVTGSVGRPQIASFHATFRGRIRGGPAEPWMEFTADQASSYGPLPERYFLMDATMKGLPVDVFHRFACDGATFSVRVLSLVTAVEAKGPEMNRSETVTLFNDLAVFAPARLADPAIRWEAIDDRSARAHYTRGAETIAATLFFDERGELVDFASDDRSQASPDGKSFARLRWTTPVRDYRERGGRRVSTHGEARWDAPGGSYAYVEMDLVSLEYRETAAGAAPVAGAR